MKNSELLYMMAKANRDSGYESYADRLERWATVKEAEEIKEDE